MRSESLLQASTMLRSVESLGVSIAARDSSAPSRKLLGIQLTWGTGRGSVDRMLVDAERSVQLMADAGFSPTSIQDVRQATNLISDARTRQSGWYSDGRGVREAVPELTRAVSQARSQEQPRIVAAAREHANAVLSATPESRSVARIDELEGLSQLPDVIDQVPALRTLHLATLPVAGSKSLQDFQWRAIDEARDTARLLADPTAARAELQRIISTDPIALQNSDVQRFLALTSTDPSPAATSSGLRSHDTKRLNQPDVRRIFVKQQMHDETTTAIDSRIATMLDGPLETLSPMEWAYIDEGLKTDAARGLPLAQRAEMLLSRSSGSLADVEWAQLALVLDHDPDRVITAIPRQIAEARSFRDVARDLAAGDRAQIATAERYFSGHRFANLDADERLRQMQQVRGTASAELSRADWHVVTMMLDQNATSELTAGATDFAWRRAASSLAWDLATSPAGRDLHEQPSYVSWSIHLDPNRDANIATSVARVVEGAAAPSDRLRVALSWDSDPKLLLGRPPAEQLRLIAALLESTDVESGVHMHSPLSALRSALAALDVPAELEPLRSETTLLVNNNLLRMAGVTPPGEARGLIHRVNYDEMGSIRGNLEILDEATMPTPPQAQGASAELVRW